MNRDDLIIEVAVYLADYDEAFNYTCAFDDLPESKQLYYKGMAKEALECIEEWTTIHFIEEVQDDK